MSTQPPPNQPTVARSGSGSAWLVFVLIGLFVVAWNVQTFMLEGREPARATPAQAASGTPPVASAPAADPLAGAAQAPATALPAAPAPPPAAALAPPATDACSAEIARSGLQLPADFRVLAAGGYGGRELPYQIDQSGHAATQIDVVVSSPDKPVALMLGAYEPTVWKVSWTRGTRILGVFAGGYHSQRVAGLPRGLPLLNSSYQEHGACPYFYLGGESMDKLNPAARRVFGRPVDMVYPAGKDGTVYAGAPGPIGGIESSADTAVTSFVDRAAPLAGQPGIEEAIRLGQLRRAGPGDVGLWAQALAQSGQSYDLPPVSGQGPAQPIAPPPDVYVVTGEFTFPSGLYGAHSVTFVVPAGTPRPHGNPGHSPVLMLH
jgi:hypothetical protein